MSVTEEVVFKEWHSMISSAPRPDLDEEIVDVMKMTK